MDAGDMMQAAGKRIHRPRIMPVLLMMSDGLLYKTQKFKNPKYVGDPKIAVKIFNDKCADELVLLDIMATKEKREPRYDLIEQIAGEAFMPVAYGGGITKFEQAKKIFSLGIEKIVINSAFYKSENLIRDIADHAGSQSVVVSVDAKKNMFGKYSCYSRNGTVKQKRSPIQTAQDAEKCGAGEIFINAIDHDGMFTGYDKILCNEVADAVSIPVIACGGAAKIEDCAEIIKQTEVAAAAAGSIFVFQGPHRAVLIKFPDDGALNKLFA